MAIRCEFHDSLGVTPSNKGALKTFKGNYLAPSFEKI
jgi:hypothetical protein